MIVGDTTRDIDNEAPFYMDLLSVCAALMFGEDEAFVQLATYRYGGTQVNLGEQTVVGIGHAASLLADVYDTEGFLSGSVLPHLAINPLVQHLSVDLTRLQTLRVPHVSLRSLPEGCVVGSEVHYLEFNTTYFMMAVVALAMDRIVSYQTHVATDTRNTFQKIQLSHPETPVLLNLGSRRQYTTTLAAYFARARNVAGMERFIDPALKNKSQSLAKEPQPREWQLKSHEFIRGINDEEHRALMSQIYGQCIADQLISDEIYFLKNEDYLAYSLASFALDGEVANSFRVDGDLAFSVSGGKSVEETDGFIVDGAYQAIWTPFDANQSAVYGVQGRALPASLATYGDRPFARARWSRIPKILVNDEHELRDIIARVREGFPARDIYFRGQGRHFSLPRSQFARRLLYGNPNVDELSLPTAASRRSFEFDSFVAAFQLQVQGLLYTRRNRSEFRQLRANSSVWGPVSPFRDRFISDMYEKWFRLFYSTSGKCW